MANERVLTHHFTLLNPTSTVAEFKLATLTRTFTVSNICLKRDVPLDVNQVVTLKPQKSISVSRKIQAVVMCVLFFFFTV